MAINEVLEALVPENARFVSGQDIFLYVPKAQTDRRYGLVKYSPSDFTIDTNGILSLLLPKSQIEDYFSEILGGSRDQTVIASPKINLLNLHKTDKELQNEVLGLHKTDEDLHNEDIRLQDNIDFLIQDNRASDATDSTYSAQKITQLIREAKMQGLHFVGYIGKELGVDEDGTSIVKEGALWHVSDSTEKPVINGSWSEDTMYKCVNGEWVKSEEYIPSDFDIWKNIDLPDSEINTWWFFDNHFEVLDFNVDMDLYYTKVQSDHRFKSNFTYGDYLYEKDGKINIDNLILPTSSKYSIFDTDDSNLTSTNVEDAIKELEDHADEEIKLINDRPVLLSYNSIPYRVGDYAVNKDGVYRSVASEDGFIWELVTEDLDNLLPRINANRYIVKGINFSNDKETGYLYSDLSVINLNNEEESNIPFSVPVATRNNDGIMPATAMRAISELDIKVEALQSGVKSYFVKFETDEPSQTALDLLYQEQSGDTGIPPNLTRLIDVNRNIYYEYYTSLEDHWQGPYIYRYAVASFDQAGLVQSSEQKGQIYVEPVSGLMSLNGYTDIINTFNSLYGGEERAHIAVSQVPELPTTKITSGTLDKDRLPIVPISKGGTNNSAFSAYKLVVTGNVDETDNTANSLLDGPSFGAANTLLTGQGANQLPIFKSINDLKLLKLDGSNYYVKLSQPSDNGGAIGFRHIATCYIGNWSHKALSLIVKSRHSGTGLLTIGIATHGSLTNNLVGSIRFYGSTDANIKENSWKMICDITSGEVKVYWRYWDGDDCEIKVLDNNGFTTLWNYGEWLTTEPTAGENQVEYLTLCYDKEYLPLTGGTLTGAVNFNSGFPQIKTNQPDFIIQTKGGQQYDFTDTEFRPTASYVNTLNIGRSDRKFKDAYFSGSVNVPYIKHTADLGLVSDTSVFRFGTSANVNSVAVLAGGSYNFFRPGTNNTLDLGTSTQKWKDGYFAGTVNAGALSLLSPYPQIKGAGTNVCISTNGAWDGTGGEFVFEAGGLRPSGNRSNKQSLTGWQNGTFSGELILSSSAANKITFRQSGLSKFDISKNGDGSCLYMWDYTNETDILSTVKGNMYINTRANNTATKYTFTFDNAGGFHIPSGGKLYFD